MRRVFSSCLAQIKPPCSLSCGREREPGISVYTLSPPLFAKPSINPLPFFGPLLPYHPLPPLVAPRSSCPVSRHPKPKASSNNHSPFASRPSLLRASSRTPLSFLPIPLPRHSAVVTDIFLLELTSSTFHRSHSHRALLAPRQGFALLAISGPNLLLLPSHAGQSSTNERLRPYHIASHRATLRRKTILYPPRFPPTLSRSLRLASSSLILIQTRPDRADLLPEPEPFATRILPLGYMSFAIVDRGDIILPLRTD